MHVARLTMVELIMVDLDTGRLSRTQPEWTDHDREIDQARSADLSCTLTILISTRPSISDIVVISRAVFRRNTRVVYLSWKPRLIGKVFGL